MTTTRDRIRVAAVVVTAVAQVSSSPLTSLAVGPSSNTGAISDAYRSPVTPAGYAFAIWGLIYFACLALAVYQLLPSQHQREVHRRTGWWLVGAFTASAVWVPIFGLQLIWLSQVVIVSLVVFLVFAARGFVSVGPAADARERILLRLPVTIYLGWATLATGAGFGLTFRSFGMPESARWVTQVSLVLVLSALITSLFVVGRLAALAGFLFTACWALVAIAVGTYVSSVRVAVLIAAVILLAAALGRTLRSPDRRFVLLG